MNYNILDRIGNLILLVQPWLIGFLILSLVALGVAFLIAGEKVRAHSKEIFICYAVGAAIAFGAKPIGQSLAGVFKVASVLVNHII